MDELKKDYEYTHSLVEKYGYGLTQISENKCILIIQNGYVKKFKIYKGEYTDLRTEHSDDGPSWMVYRPTFDRYVEAIIENNETGINYRYPSDKFGIFVDNNFRYMRWILNGNNILDWCKENNIDPLNITPEDKNIIKLVWAL